MFDSYEKAILYLYGILNKRYSFSQLRTNLTVHGTGITIDSYIYNISRSKLRKTKHNAQLETEYDADVKKERAVREELYELSTMNKKTWEIFNAELDDIIFQLNHEGFILEHDPYGAKETILDSAKHSSEVLKVPVDKLFVFLVNNVLLTNKERKSILGDKYEGKEVNSESGEEEENEEEEEEEE